MAAVVWEPHRWMTDIEFALASRRLNQVRMVGSHDAATYGISSSSYFGPDAPGLLRGEDETNDSSALSRIVKFCARPVSHGWAKTQQLTVLQQLLKGSRYLDLRVAYAPQAWRRSGCREDDGPPFFATHTLLSVPFRDVVRDVAAFVGGDFGGNSKDVIVMDIQHIFGVGSRDTDVCRAFFELLRPLEQYFFPPLLGPQSTLGEIWATPFRVLLCVGAKELAYCPSYAHQRPSVLHSPWHNSNSAQGLMDRLLGVLESDLRETCDAVKGETPDADTLQPLSSARHCATPPNPSSPVNEGSPLCSPSGSGLPDGNRARLYVTQAVMSPFVSDITVSFVSVLRSTPRTIRDYAQKINTVALRWFRDVNLCKTSRSEILSESVRKRHLDEANRLGLVWDADIVNTHSNILLLDYIEEGSCEWFVRPCVDDGEEASGSDPSAKSSVIQRTPVKRRLLKRYRDEDTREGSTIAALIDREPKSTEYIELDAVALCVCINLKLHRTRKDMEAHAASSSDLSSAGAPPPPSLD